MGIFSKQKTKLYQSFESKFRGINPEDALKARVAILLAVFFGATLVIAIPIRHAIVPLHSAVLIESVIVFALCAFSLHKCWKFPESLSGRLAITLALVVFVPGSAYRNGGISAPVVSMLLIFPMVAMFMLGRLPGIFMYLASTTLLGTLTYMNLNDLLPTPIVGRGQKREIVLFMVYTIVMGFSLILGLIFEWQRRRNEALAAQLAETEGVRGMIVMVSHELNNPLMIATGSLDIYKATGDGTKLENLENSLKRIIEIGKRIRAIDTENGPVAKEKYGKDSQMIKLPDAG